MKKFLSVALVVILVLELTAVVMTYGTGYRFSIPKYVDHVITHFAPSASLASAIPQIWLFDSSEHLMEYTYEKVCMMSARGELTMEEFYHFIEEHCVQISTDEGTNEPIYRYYDCDDELCKFNQDAKHVVEWAWHDYEGDNEILKFFNEFGKFISRIVATMEILGTLIINNFQTTYQLLPHHGIIEREADWGHAIR